MRENLGSEPDGRCSFVERPNENNHYHERGRKEEEVTWEEGKNVDKTPQKNAIKNANRGNEAWGEKG